MTRGWARIIPRQYGWVEFFDAISELVNRLRLEEWMAPPPLSIAAKNPLLPNRASPGQRLRRYSQTRQRTGPEKR